MDTKISDIGEERWISIIQKYLSPPEHLSLDDDAVDYELPMRYTVINMDTWVESTDRPLAMDMISCGYKAVINAVSDVVAKGAVPLHVLTSINLPGFTSVSDATRLLEGISYACTDIGLSYRGGDVNQQSSDISITVTCIGQSKFVPIPRHNTLKLGDEVWWLGPPLGSTGAILHLLLNAEEDMKFFAKEVERYFFRPSLSMNFPRFAEVHREFLISSMDCSDGLAKTLYSLLEGSDLSIGLRKNVLNVASWIRRVSEDSVRNFVLFGGEELGVVFISRDIDRNSVKKLGAVKLGEVRESTMKLTLNGRNIENRGWQHFKDM